MKERLTGAIILVALIVLLVPELLTGPIRSAPRAVATSEGGPQLRSYTITLSDEARAKPADPQTPAVASPAPVPLPATASPAPEDSAPAAAAQATEAPAPPPAPVATPAPAAATAHPRSDSSSAKTTKAAPAPAPPAATDSSAAGAFMIQLGSFASRANADRFAQKLKSQGFSASVSQGSGGRHLYRVRVGPAHDHGAALQLQSKLQAAGHVGALVPK